MIYFLLQATSALRVKSTQDALCQSQAKDEGSALTFKMQRERGCRKADCHAKSSNSICITQ